MQEKPSAPKIDGLMMKDGKMMMVKNGSYTKMNQTSMTLKDGTTVLIDGTVKKKNGATVKLKEGEEIKMTGEILSGDNKTIKNTETEKKNSEVKSNKDKTMYLVPDSTIKK